MSSCETPGIDHSRDSATMAGFPSTRPAFTMTVMIKEPHLVGSISRGTPLTVVPIVGGTVRSEPGFEPAFNARFQGTGNDYIHTDPTGKHMRLDAHVVLLYVASCYLAEAAPKADCWFSSADRTDDGAVGIACGSHLN